MDEIFLSSQKVKLLHEKKRLEEEIKKTATYPESGTSDDDREQEITQFEDDQAVGNQLINEKEAVDSALEAISGGTYGKCKKCQGEISRERLEAYPAAEECLKCSAVK